MCYSIGSQLSILKYFEHILKTFENHMVSFICFKHEVRNNELDGSGFISIPGSSLKMGLRELKNYGNWRC